MNFSRETNLDNQIRKITKSTRATVPVMIPLHDILRHKANWYYKWHLNPYSSRIHFLVLILSIIGIGAGLYFNLFGLPKITFAAPATVGTSTSSNANTYSFQRKTFYDSTNSKYWSFYYNGSAIAYYYSSDGASWTSSGTIAVSTYDFSVWRNGSDVYLIYNNSGIQIYKGALSATSISWGTSQTVDSTTGTGNVYVTQDSNNKIWTIYRYTSRSSSAHYAKRSTNASDITVWDTRTTLDSTSSDPLIVSLLSGDVYAIWNTGAGGSILGKKYTNSTSTWDASATTIFATSGYISAVSDSSGNIHLTYSNASNTTYYIEYTGSWGSPVTIDSTHSGMYVSIILNSADNNLWIFWSYGVDNNVYYKKGVSPYASGNWDTNATSLYSTGVNNFVSAGYYTTGSKVFLQWQNSNASPFNIYFDNSVSSATAATRYWINNTTGNWNDTANWSATSGGAGGATVPVAGDTAVFDNAGSTHNGALTINATVNIGTLDFQAAYTGAITQGANTITTTTAMNLNGTNLTAGADITASGTLTIGAGKTLDLAGHNITVTGTYTNNGTLKMTGGETTVSLTNDSAHGTIEYTGTTGPYTIKNFTYYGLKINGAATTFNQPAAALTVNGTFNVAAGTYVQGGNNLSVNGDFTLTNGTTYTKGTGAAKLIIDGGVGGKTFTDSNTTKQDLGALQVGASPGTTNLASDMSASSLTIPTGDILNTKGYEVTITGAISITGTMDTTDNGGAGYEGDGSIITSGGTFTINTGGVFTKCTQTSRRSLVKINGGAAANFTSNAQDMGDFQTSVASTNVTLQDALNADAITIDASTTLTANNQNISVGENYANAGTFTAGSGTVTFDKASGTQTLNSGGTGTGFLFNNLTHSGAGTLQLVTNTLDVNGTFTNSSGTFDAATNNLNMTFAGAWNNTGSATFSRGSGSMTFDGTSTLTDSSSAAGDLGAVTVSIASTLTLGSNAKMTSLLGGGGLDTFNMGAGSYNLTLTGTGTPLTVTIFQKGTGSTVTYTGTTTATNIASRPYNNLTLTPTATTTYSLAGHLYAAISTAMTGTLTINNFATLTTTASNYNIDCLNLTVATGGTLTANASTFTLTGNWNTASGTLNANTSTVIMTNTGTIDATYSTAGAFNNLTLNPGAGKTITMNTHFRVVGILTLQSGTLNGAAAGKVIDIVNPTATAYSNTGMAFGANIPGVEMFMSGASSLAPTIIPGGVNTTYPNLVFYGLINSATGYGKLNGDITVNGNVSIASIYAIGTGYVDTNSYNITATSSYTQIGWGGTSTGTLKFTGTSIFSTSSLIINAGSGAWHNTVDVSSGSNTINISSNYANSDTFTAGTGTVNFTATNTGHTINPGSSSFYNLTFSGSGGAWSPLTNTVTVTNDLTMAAGTFNTATGTANVTVNGTVSCGASCGTINMTSTNTFTQRIGVAKNFGTNVAVATNWTFNNLNFENSSAGDLTVTTASIGTGQIIIGGTLTIGNASDTNKTTLDDETNDRIIAGGNLVITSKGALSASSTAATSFADVTINTGGTLTANASTITVSGNWDSSAGTFTYGTSTVNMTGTGTKTINPPTTNYWTAKFFNLDVGQVTGKTTQALYHFGVANQLYVGSGTFDLNSKSIYFYAGGNPIAMNASATFGTGNGTIQMIAGVNQNLPAHTYNIATFRMVANNNIVTQTGDVTITGDLYVGDNYDNAITVTYNTSNFVLNVNGNLNITRSTSTLNLGSSNMTVGGNWTNPSSGVSAGTVSGTSTVTFNKAVGTQTLNSGGTGANQAFNNLTHSGAGTLQLLTNALKVSGIFTNSNGTFDANNLNVNVAGNFNISGGSFSPKVGGGATTQTVTLDGAGGSTQAISGSTTFNHLTATTAAARTLQFTASSTTTVAGTWTITGAAGQLITLSSSAASAWTINPTAANVSYVNTSYSTNTGIHFCAAYSTNGGNNTTWSFSTGATCNDSITLNVDNNSLTFGNLLPGNVFTGTTITTVTTNYGNGYTLGVNDNIAGTNSALVHDDGVTYIADYTGTITTPTLWSGTGLGICVYAATNKDTAKWGTGTTEADSNNKYAGVPQATTTINSKTGSPTTNDQAYIGYKLVVPNTQKTGNYSGTITYTATGVIY
ncbi:MAG: hypothetical protein M1429_00525 [Patescibacteria group bacterium]|nr:hypothetical protein [Patescibacteria group bacterium]